MGLAASQARYLALTSRKSDLEYQSQTINSRRIQLAYKTAEIAREYSEGMNNSRIKISFNKVNTATGSAELTWEELTFKNLAEQGYMLIGSQGSRLEKAPYVEDRRTTIKYAKTVNYDNIPEAKRTLPAADFDELVKAHPELAALYKENEKDDDTGKVKNYTLVGSLTDETNEGKAAIEALEGLAETDTYFSYKGYYDIGDKNVTTWKVNPDYKKGQDADIQSLLVSGQAQIVTKDFYAFLCNNGYDYRTGLTGTKDFAKLMEEWQTNTNGINPTETKSVIDWRADEDGKFGQRSYTEDDEKVLAKYEADTAKVQAQDKMLEIQEKNIETQHKAIETELEAIKKIIEKNIQETFKIFS